MCLFKSDYLAASFSKTNFLIMGFSGVVHTALFPVSQLDVGALVKAFSVGVLIVLVLKFIKSLTTRSPYDHIPGPEPSSMFGEFT